MFNGDVGRIADIDAGGEWLALDFDGRKALYSVEMLSEIDLAYAQTVHKAQGSEYRCVVLAAMPAAPGLMVRGVLYTALTRARELLVIVGDDAAIRSMAANDKRQKRYSGLKWRLSHRARRTQPKSAGIRIKQKVIPSVGMTFFCFVGYSLKMQSVPVFRAPSVCYARP